MTVQGIRHKILVVDDDLESVSKISNILKTAEYDILTSENVKKAIDTLNTQSEIDLVISDIVLPDVDGFKLLEYIQNTPRLVDIPTLITSTNQDHESVTRSIKLGAKDYMIKPVDDKKLLIKVNKIIQSTIHWVLTVDDDSIILNLLKKILERAGYKILTASSGVEALKLMETHKISLIITDIEMPEMNGIELLTKVKENNPNMPVMVITGKGSTHDKKSLLRAGADGYITKPFKNFEVVESIHSRLRA